MMKIKILICFLCFGMLSGCKNNGGENALKPTNKEDVSRPNNELYQNYTASPTTQAQKDENAIIDFASSKGLKCERMQNGVYVCDLEKGNGVAITRSSNVTAHYRGYLFDGTEFDASYNRNEPIKFRVGQMIKGWNEWLITATEGTKATLLIPSAYAYGSRARGKIPAHSPLAFDVHVLMPGEE